MADQTKQKAVYAFLRDHARAGTTFSVDEICAKVVWKRKTAETYLSKQYAAYVEKTADGRYRLIPEFRRVSWDEFQELVTQVRRPLASYNRATYRAVVVYDFLMPLTREDKLRKALDALFYRDTLARRIQEVGLETFAKSIPRKPGDNDGAYMGRILAFIDDRIGGFSVSHVSGRFRIGPILSRPEAAKRLEHDEPYLIDETTAVVRFIIPCQSTRTQHGLDFDLDEVAQENEEAVAREVRQIRTVFFDLFVEALVPTIRGEKLIWMLETTPMGQRLYELDLVKPAHGARSKGSEDAEEEENDDPDSD
jgi:hypothetical protein